MSNQDISLRNYIATQALNGMLANKQWFGDNMRWKSVEEMVDQYTEEAYKFADSMIKASSK